VTTIPRDGSGIYSKLNASAVTQTTIASAQYNGDIDDLVTDANAVRPVSAGGTGGATAAAARVVLDVAQQQSSVADATEGRGLVVGAGGLLASGITQTDWDSTVSTNKFIRTGAASTPNAPSTADVWSGLNVKKNTTTGWQIAADSTNGKLRLRTQNASTWSDWGDVIYTITTTEGSSGVAFRYSNGWQKCVFTGTTLSCDTSSGGIFVSSAETWNFPLAFIEEPRVTYGTQRVGGGRVWAGGTQTISETAVSAVLLASVTGTTGLIMYIAEGYWRD
jgi:hypothetical protein